MISPDEIKEKAKKRYLPFLQSKALGLPFSEIVIPGDKKHNGLSFPEFSKAISALAEQSKEKKGFGFSVEYQTLKTKNFGDQRVPAKIYFETEKDFLKYLGKEKEAERFLSDREKIVSLFPELAGWIEKHPLKTIENHGEWENLLKVCCYFKANPQPGLYIRELPIQVHTKFVEKNKGIIRELLEILILPFINTLDNVFEKRFGLKMAEPLIRFKILDRKISDAFFSGIDDISIPVSRFENLKLPVKKVLIVENKTSLYTVLTLPEMENAIAVFGQGNAVSNLHGASWLQQTEILYWGDMDVQGFEILSRVRSVFPHTVSVMMDRETFDKYFENDCGTPSNNMAELYLDEKEKQLYELLKSKNWRLEQEKIPIGYVNGQFATKDQGDR